MQTLHVLLLISWIAVSTVAAGSLEQTIVGVLRRFARPLQEKHNSLLIENLAVDEQPHRSQADLINAVLAQLDGQVLVRFDVQGVPSYNSLTLVDGRASFDAFLRRFNQTRYSLEGFVWIVVCQQVDVVVKNELVQQILEDLWEQNLMYGFVSIADGDQDEEVEVFTYWPYTERHCGAVEAVSVDWRSDDTTGDRLQDFYGCPVRVGAFDNQPFIMLDWDNLGRTSLKGFEGLLVNAIAEKLNFSVEVVTPPNNDQWGYPRRDGNSTGLVKLIVDETVDFGICSLGYTEDRDAVMVHGVQHYNSYVVFGVPSGRPYTAFEKLFLPFDWNTWCAVFGTLGLSIGIILLVNTRSNRVKEFVYGRGFCGPVTNLVNLLLGGPSEWNPTRTFARTLMMHWLIFTLVIRTAYQGSLFKYLQEPKNFSAPLTMDAIDKSGLYYYMIDLAAEYFTNYPNIQARTRFVSHEQPLLESINQLGRGELYGVVLGIIDHIAYHNKFSPKDEYVQAAREAILSLTLTIYYPKRTFLRHTIDREIQMIDSSGLMQYWANQYGDYDFSRERRTAAGHQALTVDNLIGPMQVWGVLLAVAALVFIVEVSTKWCAMIKGLVDWIEKDR